MAQKTACPGSRPIGGKTLTIHGNGAIIRRSIISNTPAFGIFYIDIGAHVTISRLTIRNGYTGFGGACLYINGATVILNESTLSGNLTRRWGGAIMNDGSLGQASLTVNNCLFLENSDEGLGGGAIINYGTDGSATLMVDGCNFSSNSASRGSGGAILNWSLFSGGATVTVNNSTFSGNFAGEAGGGGRGGAIHNDTTVRGNATVTLTNCTFSINSASDGGGVGNSAGNMEINSCTMDGNSADYGGGAYNEYDGATMHINNSTLSGNSARYAAGAIYCNGDETVMVSNSTLNDNLSGSSDPSLNGAIVNYYSTRLEIGDSILKMSGSTPNFSSSGSGGIVISHGHNLSNDSGGGVLNGPGDQINTDPMLDPGGLKNNGGPTQTIALLSNSPAINNASTSAPPHDQRGYLRSGAPDIGTFEFGGTIPGALGNISTRGFVQTGNNVLIGGLIVSGNGPKKVIVRALGPTLGKPPFNVPGALANPILQVRDSSNVLVASNDNWGTASNKQAIIDSGFAPPDSLESAILTTLNPGNYTAIVRGVNDTTGVALVEAHDQDFTAGSRFGNISTRGFVQTGANVMIAGVIVHGPDSQDVVIRGLGPTLSQFGVPTVLADPVLELRDANGGLMASNDNWKQTQQALISATGLAPPNDNESAIEATLSPANYTAILRGNNNTTANALVEVYSLN